MLYNRMYLVSANGLQRLPEGINSFPGIKSRTYLQSLFPFTFIKTLIIDVSTPEGLRRGFYFHYTRVTPTESEEIEPLTT